MSNQEQEPTEVTNASKTSAADEHDASAEKSPPAPEPTTPSDQEPMRRLKMPQDVRYATEQGDRDKLAQKYENYQVSDANACNIRFLIDHRQKKNLLGRPEEEESNLQTLGKTFNVSLLPAYQNPPKHSFKMLGTESNVRKCLAEVLSQVFKAARRSMVQTNSETQHEQTSTTADVDQSEGTNLLKSEQKSPPHPTSIFVTTINTDSSITEEKKPIAPSTPNRNEEKTAAKEERKEQDACHFVPLDRKPEYTFTILITGQGQEVLKKNWSFFAGPLQQRLNVTVTNPFKLPKFGDNPWQNELAITGELFENIVDAALQLTAFTNDVLGVPAQPYRNDEERPVNDSNNHGRSKVNNNYDHHPQRRQEYNNNNAPRQSPSNQQSDRTPFNRGRGNGAYEQIIFIRSNCVARIVGARGSNLRRIQSKCHLRDIIVARQSNDDGYVECTLSAYQPRNLTFAIDTIWASLRNEDDQAIQVREAQFVEAPPQSSSYPHSPHNDQPQLSAPNSSVEHFQAQPAAKHRQQAASLTSSSDFDQNASEPGFLTRPLHFANGTQAPQPAYNFRNTPSFDFTHQPSSAARKTDKRPGEVNDSNHSTVDPTRTSTDSQSQHTGGSSSSNSSSVSPRHKSKRTCPETKEIDCTTDAGFWIQKQYYHALDDASKELFDSLLEKLEKIRIANEENAARKQQRLVGRNRLSKSRAFMTAIAHANGDKDSFNAKVSPTRDTVEASVLSTVQIEGSNAKDEPNGSNGSLSSKPVSTE